MATGPVSSSAPMRLPDGQAGPSTLRGHRTHRPREGAGTRPVTRQDFLELTRRALLTQEDGFQSVGVVCVGLSGFREVATMADTAEQVLQGLTERWRQRLRSGDVLGHVGVDRFAFLCTGPAAEIMSVADRVATAVDDPVALPQGIVQVSAALGVVIAEPELRSPEDLLERCGQVMRSSIRRGQLVEPGWHAPRPRRPDLAVTETSGLDLAVNRIFAASLEIASVDALSDHAAQEHLTAAVAELDAAIGAIRRSVHTR
jgi:GGDEF domain-containing protein